MKGGSPDVQPLLQRAERAASNPERAIVIAELRAFLSYCAALVAEQPDPGAAAVLSEVLASDIAAAGAALRQLRESIRPEPPHIEPVRIVLRRILARRDVPSLGVNSPLWAALRRHDPAAKRGTFLGHVVLPQGEMLSFENPMVATLRSRIAAAPRGSYGIAQMTLVAIPVYAAFVSDGSGDPLPHQHHAAPPDYADIYAEMAQNELDRMCHEIKHELTTERNREAIDQFGLVKNITFSNVTVQGVEYSSAKIMRIGETGILDLVLRKRGSVARYPMPVDAAVFVAGLGKGVARKPHP